MDTENTKTDYVDQIEEGNKRTHRLALLAAGALAAVTGGHLAHEAIQPAEMKGEQIVRIVPGDTVNGIVNTEVDGGASHTGDVSEWVVNANPEVFQDGEAFLGSEDLGEEIVIPESAK